MKSSWIPHFLSFLLQSDYDCCYLLNANLLVDKILHMLRQLYCKPSPSYTKIFTFSGMSMWSNLPFDLLANIFSFLTPDSLARARSVCKNWNTCSEVYPLAPTTSSWFLALPIRNHRPYCYAHNPVMQKWHQLSLPLPSIRPTAPVGSLLLLRVTNSTTLKLALCNPFTREFRYLPHLHIARTNPAVGVTILESPNHDVRYKRGLNLTEDISISQRDKPILEFSQKEIVTFNVRSCFEQDCLQTYHDVRFPWFRVYVAGGMSDAGQGGATYETNVEMYDSRIDTWQVVGSMPVEFAVRLTVWTPNENVCIGDTLYWITSARAYSVMGFEVSKNRWRELGVPMAERLEFATLVKRNGVLALVGGMCCGSACIWELNEGVKWCLVDKVPLELGLRLLSGKRVWESVKCVGNEDVICLYRDLGFGMVVCNKVGSMGRWEWAWVDGCGYIKGKQVENCIIRGALIHPTLTTSFK